MKRKYVDPSQAITGLSDSSRQEFDRLFQKDQRNFGLYLGFVEDDYDPQKNGRVLVHVPELSPSTKHAAGKKKGETKDQERTEQPGYIWCYPVSPSFGSTDAYGSEDGFSLSYGFWGPQPRRGDYVLVGFMNGTTPVWIGCVPKPRKNFMVPGTPTDQIEGEEGFVAGTERPRKGSNQRVPLTLNSAIRNAGLINDRIRGIGTSGSTRESPSRVAGILTPGHPKQNKPGHSFVMDDLPEQQGVRLRTSHGHQLTFSDVSNSIYVATGQGNNWIEISQDGKIDIYAKDSVSIHTESDMNVRTDGNYYLDVAGSMYTKVGGNYKLEVSGNADELFSGYLKTNVSRTYDIQSSGNYKLVSDARIDTLSTNTTAISSKAQLLIYGQGDLGIDSGANVRQEQGLATLPSFTVSSTTVASTINSTGLTPSNVTQLANNVNVSSLIGQVDPGALNGAITSISSIASNTGVPVAELGSMTTALVSNGVDISTAPSLIQSTVTTLGSPNSEQLGILTGSGLTEDQFDIPSLGLSKVMDNIKDAGLSQVELTTLFGTTMALSFAGIVSQTSALSSTNNVMSDVDLNSFREKSTNITESLSSSNINNTQAVALSALLSKHTNPVTDVSGAINSLTSTLENPSNSAKAVYKRLGIDSTTLDIGAGVELPSALKALQQRGLTLSSAKAAFGEKYGEAVLGILDNAPNAEVLMTSLAQLETIDPNALNNLLTLPEGYGADLANLTSIAGALNLDTVDINDLGSVLDQGLLNAAPVGSIPTNSLPGVPSPTQIRAGQSGSNENYIGSRVPQHEPWKPEGRIAPAAVKTPGAGQISASDRGTETASDRNINPITGQPATGPSDDEAAEMTEDDIRYIVVHCAASQNTPSTTKQSIERYHINARGWSHIGYHYVIENSGAVVQALPETQRGIHVGAGNVNQHSIAICMVGGVNADNVPTANFTERQLAALRQLINEVSGRYPNAELKGHRDFNHLYPDPRRRKACPSFDVHHWWTDDELISANI